MVSFSSSADHVPMSDTPAMGTDITGDEAELLSCPSVEVNMLDTTDPDIPAEALHDSLNNLDSFISYEGHMVTPPMPSRAITPSHPRAKEVIRKTNRLVKIDNQPDRYLKEGPGDELVGQIVFGNYAILDVIGQGGMAIVYLAKQLTFDRLVALKTLARYEPSVMARFAQEAQTHCRLRHKNIVRVYDRLKSQEGQTFLIMEYVDGVSLLELLKSEGTIKTIDDIAAILSQIGDALSYAHSKGVIHRDLKPSNIALYEENYEVKVKVLDFGLAKTLDSCKKLTNPGLAVGSPDYMSPEHFTGKINACSDIYSLGVLAYQMITGKRAYTFSTITDLIAAMKDESIKPKPINEIRPDLENASMLNEIVMKAMSADQNKRHRSAREFVQDIKRWQKLAHTSCSEMLAIKSDEEVSKFQAQQQSRQVRRTIGRMKALKKADHFQNTVKMKMKPMEVDLKGNLRNIVVGVALAVILTVAAIFLYCMFIYFAVWFIPVILI